MNSLHNHNVNPNSIRCDREDIRELFYYGVVHKWRHGLGGEGVNDFVTTVIGNKKRDDEGEGLSKIV